MQKNLGRTRMSKTQFLEINAPLQKNKSSLPPLIPTKYSKLENAKFWVDTILFILWYNYT